MVLERFASFRPPGTAKSVKAVEGRYDDVLITDARLPHGHLPWARLRWLCVLHRNDITYELAYINTFESTTAKWIDSLTYAPHLQPTDVFQFIPATCINQKVFTCLDTRPDSNTCVWVNWFLTWGPLKYPMEHRDQIFTDHDPTNRVQRN